MLRLAFVLLCFSHISLNAQSYSTYKPWAYWWWMGSAVTKEDIKANLSDYALAGLGGLHIIPIYGVKGFESSYIDFRSKAWYDILDYTIHEAEKLGLGIDITLGTGWPFGGPQVNNQDAAQNFKIQNNQFVVSQTLQKVKRAAPGGEGWVLDHFSKKAVANYINSFEDEFKIRNHKVRAFYNDSYEVYGANWTHDLPTEFLKRRGYEFNECVPILQKDSITTLKDKLLLIDYHETLSDLLLESFTKPLQSFSKKYNKLFRNEAHGAPANILDLYAASDVPETEYFGSRPYNIPLVNQDPDYSPNRFGTPGALVMKLASSAAHIGGKKLVSSETSTWLANHFKVSLKQIKPILDESFIAGVNHIFYHGITYSPKSEDWPGWLFYASTNFNQQSHFWNQFPFLNTYISNCQQYLQESKPDNDLLVYFPMYDEWSKMGNQAKLNMMDVHTMQRDGIFSGDLGTLCKELTNAGYQYDFVSDKQLKESTTLSKNIHMKGGYYKGLIIPKCGFMPLQTLQKIKEIESKGVPVTFVNQKPTYTTGLFQNELNQKKFDQIINTTGKVSTNPINDLNRYKLLTENLSKHQLSFIRKKYQNGQFYFISNQNQKFNNGLVSFNQIIKTAVSYDPVLNKYYSHPILDKKGIYLNLASGKSTILFINTIPVKATVQTKIIELKETLTQDLSGNWKIEFNKGNPVIPGSFESSKLTSWTTAPDTMAKYYNGTGTYTLHFRLNENMRSANQIDLGDVRETAEVKINGVLIGTAWYAPFILDIPSNILKAENTIEIKVTNLSANRIKYLDMQKHPWKKFNDINIVDINYKPFDASDWVIEASGLLGPVRLLKN